MRCYTQCLYIKWTLYLLRSKTQTTRSDLWKFLKINLTNKLMYSTRFNVPVAMSSDQPTELLVAFFLIYKLFWGVFIIDGNTKTDFLPEQVDKKQHYHYKISDVINQLRKCSFINQKQMKEKSSSKVFIPASIPNKRNRLL